MDLKKSSSNEAFEPAQTSERLAAAHHAAVTEARLLSFLGGLANLLPDWDGDGASRPDFGAIQDASSFVKKLLAFYPNQKIEQACPGAMGEIVIELREKGRSVEFLFYPNKKWKYVSVGGEQPEQGVFELENLSKIITWLHEGA